MPLKLVRRKGSRCWHVRGTVRGKRCYESAGTEDKGLAEAYRAQREAQLFEAAIFGRRDTVSFRRAAASYLSYEPRRGGTVMYVDRLVAHFDARPVDAIHQVEADAAVDAIVGPHAAAATRVRAVLTPLTAVLTHAARRQWCEFPRFQRPPVPKSVTNWIEPRQALALIDSAAPHLRPLLHFLACTGARLAEALDLQWADVDLAGRRVTFRDTKNGADRIAALPDAAVLSLANLPGRTGPVFRRDDGEPYTDRGRESGGQIRTAWATACRRAGLMMWIEAGHIAPAAEGAYTAVALAPTVTPHDLRHSWATWFYAVTKDPLLLRTEGGWHSLAMIERYAHLAPPHVSGDVRLVWGANHPRIGALPGARQVQVGQSIAETA